jgi:signal transduction histidine kinase
MVVPAPEVEIQGDGEDLTRLLVNLITNARTHGRSPIEIEAEETAAEVAINVSDRGPGIPTGEEERIFDRFYQLDQSRRAGGSGLGLAIARGIAQQLGGTLVADNRPGGGARFTLTVPKH